MSTQNSDPHRSVHDAYESSVAETPDDVAVLYTWANLNGAKYRDFSASRREYRAQLRHRNAEQVREFELQAQAEAEAAALAADQAAEAAAARHRETPIQGPDASQSRERALREAEQAARVAAAERIEAARRAEAAALAEAAARREEREIAEANASARRQLERYTESRIANPNHQPHRPDGAELRDPDLPGKISDPYTPHPPPPQPHSGARPILSTPERFREHSALRSVVSPQLRPPNPSRERISDGVPDRLPNRLPNHSPDPRTTAPQPQAAAPLPSMPAPIPPPIVAPSRRGFRPDEASGVREIYRPDPPAPASLPPRSATAAPRAPLASRPAPHRPEIRPDSRPDPHPEARPAQPTPEAAAVETPRRRRQDAIRYDSTPEALLGRRREDSVAFPPAPPPPSPAPPPSPSPAPTSGPAWLSTPPNPDPNPIPDPNPDPDANPDPDTPHPPPPASVAETLQHSRERVASRWFALKGVFEHPGPESPEPPPPRQKETRTPVVAVFSLAGGVGKTSLVATLGRSLASLGEKVLLTDTTSHGLLPFYFGASELRHGTVRTFSPPSGSTDAPISLVSYDVDGCDHEAREALAEDIARNSRGIHRVLLDLNVGSGWIAHALARSSPTILVPVAPDMNSVISLQTVERLFGEILDADGRPLKVFYLLNQFDSSLPLHLDVREVLRRRLGEHLLPFVIRRAPAVSEALAEGMTVVDYSPESPVAEDYSTAASWLRRVAAPAVAGFRNVRWSER